jgi:guanine deaminase
MLDKLYDNLDECIDECFKLSSLYADEGVKKNIGGPFGACIIQKINEKYKVLVMSRNTVLFEKDATCHAEINAIRKASKILDRFDLSDCILITTSKSCPMCISAACWAKIKLVYYSLDYEIATTNGFKDNNILDYLKNNNNNVIQEEKIANKYAIVPFTTWKNKEDKNTY